MGYRRVPQGTGQRLVPPTGQARSKAMAEGDYDTPVEGTQVSDEIGEIAAVAEGFRQVALA